MTAPCGSEAERLSARCCIVIRVVETVNRRYDGCWAAGRVMRGYWRGCDGVREGRVGRRTEFGGVVRAVAAEEDEGGGGGGYAGEGTEVANCVLQWGLGEKR